MKITHVRTARALDEPARVAYEEAQQVMEKGLMGDEVGYMRWASNNALLVNIELNGCRLLAIYKPRLGERRLWDFPDGTLYKRETAAYLTSDALGWALVPPTFLRDGTRGVGSVQLFIDHDPAAHYFTLDRDRFALPLQRMAIFDAVINNTDRKGGHCLLDADERIWGIDHGLTFNPKVPLRTVIWEYAGLAIPPDILADLRRLRRRLGDAADAYTRGMVELLSPIEMQMLQRRVEQLLEMGVFPLPGRGRNEPWPPV